MSDTSNPQAHTEAGPRFAQAAAALLAAGDVSGALALARAGTARYPWYPTGHLILGRCLQATGSAEEAARALRDAQRLLPDAPVLAEALASLGERPSTEEGAAPPPPAAPAPPDMEALARTLHGAKLELPPVEGGPEQTGAAPPAGEASAAPAAGGEGARLVSATLAEIYVQQGQYDEAIRAYRALIERQPDERERYEKRIAEIEGISRRAPRPD